MNSKMKIFIIVLALAGLILVACGGAPGQSSGSADPTSIPTVVADTQVIAEGRLVPRESVQLSFFTSGQVAEVLVEEGDLVKAGDVVARLGNREEIEAAIANTQVELLAAQQTLEALSEDLPEAQASALQALKDARDAVHNAERRLRLYDAPGGPLDIEVARANVALAKKALDHAEKEYKPYRNKPENDLRRATYLNKLDEAQDRYDDAVRRLNDLTGVTTNTFDLEQAQTELSIAGMKLELAQERHELLKNGPDPKEVAAAVARIQAAEAALVSSKEALSELELKATIDGTVVSQDLIIGQQVSPGTPVMTIADFSQMFVETDDLNEIEVVRVSAGQKVEILPDALPEAELSGTVESISDIYEEKRGDITYTVRIRVEEVDLRLRWGMTVAVTFLE